MAAPTGMTQEDRLLRAKKAGAQRWLNEKQHGGLPKALFSGVLTIGDMEFPCAVLDDGSRVLSEYGVAGAFGPLSGQSKITKKQASEEWPELPIFLAYNSLKPFITNSLAHGLFSPVVYRKGNSNVTGYSAAILPEICSIWLAARNAGALSTSQKTKAAKAEILLVALAKVGADALVDEATGYQERREIDALQKLLSLYVSEEYMKWQERFPRVFYQELFRLFGWKYDPFSTRRPALIGKFTNEFVYDQLPPGVLGELRTKNPIKDSRGTRKLRHHQFLSIDVGIPHLDKHLTALIMLMKAAEDIIEFKRLFTRATQKGLITPDSDITSEVVI